MIVSGIPYSFKRELLLGIHDFEEDMFGIALYTKAASLDPASTEEYTPVGEVDVDGYDPGGMMTGTTVREDNGNVRVLFDDVEWTAEIKARGALVYNISKDNKAVAILGFGMDQVSHGGKFKVRFATFEHPHGLIAIA